MSNHELDGDTMRDAIANAQAVIHKDRVALCESILAAGFPHVFSEYVQGPTIMIPLEYKAAMREAQGDRDNRDEAENVYRDELGYRAFPFNDQPVSYPDVP